MVVTEQSKRQLLEKVALAYDWLDRQIVSNGEHVEACRACGACCDFEKFDHRLFLTSPEVIYLTSKLGPENIKSAGTSRCPYQKDGKCTIYENRFAGCRIFFCKADRDFQSRLSEQAVARFKQICDRFDIPYKYTELHVALGAKPTNTCPPAQRHSPESIAD